MGLSSSWVVWVVDRGTGIKEDDRIGSGVWVAFSVIEIDNWVNLMD